jgi:hypothetical protein
MAPPLTESTSVEALALAFGMDESYYSNGSQYHPEEDAMAGKFEWFKDKKDKFRFRLKSGNGQIIAVSEAYESKDSCMNGIESVKKNAPDAPVVEVAG